MALKVYLIRHGETDFNKKGLEWGQEDKIPLNEIGKLQVNLLSKILREIKFDKIFSSPLTRAKQTSLEINQFQNTKIIFDDLLKEYNPGEVDPSSNKWMNKYQEMIKTGLNKYDIRPFGGENIWDLINRAKSFLRKLEKEIGVIAIVSHSGFNSVFMNLAKGKEKENFLKIKQDNSCINVLEFSEGEWEIQSINDSSHIDELFPEKTVYENQNELVDIAIDFASQNLQDICDKIFLGGDLTKKVFGKYSRPHKRYKGSTIEFYALLKKDFEIPRKWKISLFDRFIKKYEIGHIELFEVKHKVNLNLLFNFDEIKDVQSKEILYDLK